MQIRWKKLRVPIALGAITTIALSIILIEVLNQPVVYCYDEDNPEQIYWGAENCLPSVNEPLPTPSKAGVGTVGL